MDYIGKFDELPVPQRDLIATIAKTWLAKGEDPDVVAGHIKNWIGGAAAKRDTKMKPVKGDGKLHLADGTPIKPGDPGHDTGDAQDGKKPAIPTAEQAMGEIEALAAKHRKTPAGQGMTREKAIEHVITSTPEGREHYRQHKEANLRKAAAYA